jgi:hypothetical protein
MKKLITIAMLCAAAVCAPGADKKASSAPPAVTIPKDAVANPNGTYSYTDKQGKRWTYIKTPFGIVKRAADEATVKSAPPDPALTKAIDKGDTVRFERKSPFGTISWEKKKSELTDDERHILDSQTAPASTNNTAKND